VLFTQHSGKSRLRRDHPRVVKRPPRRGPRPLHPATPRQVAGEHVQPHAIPHPRLTPGVCRCLWITSGLPSCKVYPYRLRVPLRGAAGPPPCTVPVICSRSTWSTGTRTVCTHPQSSRYSTPSSPPHPMFSQAQHRDGAETNGRGQPRTVHLHICGWSKSRLGGKLGSPGATTVECASLRWPPLTSLSDPAPAIVSAWRPAGVAVSRRAGDAGPELVRRGEVKG